MLQRVLGMTVMLAALTAFAQAEGLYGVASYTPFGSQGLYHINPATGAATLIGDTGVRRINGIAWDDAANVLYAFTTNAELYTLDVNTGVATLIGDVTGIVPEGDIAFYAGMLLTVNADELGTLARPTPTYTAIGATGTIGADISGLTVTTAGELLGFARYGTGSDAILTIDPTTGAVTDSLVLGPLNGGAVGGLTTDLLSTEIYLTDGDTLYKVNVSGVGAPLTMIGGHGVSGMSGLAYVPEPASLGLLALALVVRRP